MRYVCFWIALAFTGFSAPVNATPPDFIDIYDELFGISPTHVFVMRNAQDNLGTHGGNFTFQMLVATEIATGAETIWPVYRFAVTPDYDVDDTGMTDKVVAEPQEDNHNPYDILTTFGAKPIPAAFNWRDIGLSPNNFEPLVAELIPDSLTISWDNIIRNELATDDALACMTASAAALSPYAGEYWRFVQQITPDMMLNNRSFDLLRCNATDPRQLRTGSGNETVSLARVTCDEEGQLTSLYLIVPPAAD